MPGPLCYISKVWGTPGPKVPSGESSVPQKGAGFRPPASGGTDILVWIVLCREGCPGHVG